MWFKTRKIDLNYYWSKAIAQAIQLTVSESITHLQVFVKNAGAAHGVLKIGQSYFPCLIGKHGKTFRKREGDGKSPIGRWKIEQLFFRPDKMGRPKTALKCAALKPNHGWCDEASHGQYNKFVKLPFRFNHEKLWRTDKAYNLIATTNHNQRPRIKGVGSAIFWHVINPGAKGTEGCVALSEKNLRTVLSRCSKKTYLII
jgi:L,D-peptidoglycan transpeptidase YkuD (ErfK/YbiS/YcfS/YnhG family)